jgi:peptidoglycan/xylan/chitin deacetylase (PgdA/CDA1 family)
LIPIRTLMLTAAVAATLGVTAWTTADNMAALPAGPPVAGPPAVAGVAVLPNDLSGTAGRAGILEPGDSPSPSNTPSPSTSPSPSPSDTTPPVTVARGADTRWHRKPVAIAFTATDAGSGVASTWYRIDTGPLKQGTLVVVPASADHKDDGSHLVTFFSIDNAANRETPQQVTVKIDTTAPVLRWKGVSPSPVTTQKALIARFFVREASGSVATALCVYDQYGALVLRRAGPRRAAGAGSLAVLLRAAGRPLTPGLYRLQLTLTDQAGNHSVTSLAPFRDYRPVRATVTFDLPRAGRRVALTFDDGNDEAAWARIVNTLRAYQVHGTFFALGPKVVAYAALARRTVAAGDAIGSHGWTHTDMELQSAAQIRRELALSTAAWWRVARATPVPYMRPPYGAKDAAVLSAAGASGFEHVMLWDVDPQDWRHIGSAEIAERVLSHVHPGAIVCMHTLPTTAAALPQILSGLRAMGYRAVSLPELFAAAARRR